MRLIDAADLAALVSLDDTLAAAREAAIARAEGQVVSGRLQFAWAGGESGTRFLAAALPSLDLFGYKQFHWIGSGVRYACHLFRASDGAPIGVVDAASITTLRTAATAAVGVECLYGPGRAGVVGVIGSGAEAQAGLRALTRVTDIPEARVFSRRAANREAFATRMTEELGVPVRPVASIREATDGADLVYSATASPAGAVYGRDDVGSAHVVATIGSTAPDQREARGDLFARAGRIVIDTEDAIEESGDLIEAALDPKAYELLGAALAAPARPAEPYSVFKSIGSPEQDLVLAAHILRRAEERGVGRLVAPAMSRKQNL
ncbi:hypothetical protein [Embleya scabrispora]|uniref:hypothetical protein n=1 Tax=Embleya scabrispora TaxID=159449 RepID=UPI0003744683|nr:hypothetical protein [Embleya scabrispora]MYS80742.1 ornithine cyclodeaminase [Streptomyces sp. SID5474]